jgi:hypothetical protein
MAGSDIESADPQDRAEAMDETNLTEDGGDIANFDDISDVYDATTRAGDNDVEGLEAEASEAEFEDYDEEELVMSADERDDTGMESEPDRLASGSGKEKARPNSAEPRSFESEDRGDVDVDALGYDDHRKPPEHDPHTEKQLDHGLKETFPASDPVSINPGAD